MNEKRPALECPSCGAAVPVRIRFIKLAVCEHCSSTLFVQDDAVIHVGKKSMLTDIPSIFKVGAHYKYRNTSFEAVGRIQFDYGDGLWDEWWVLTNNGEGKWFSVDEGDIVMEVPFKLRGGFSEFNKIHIDQKLKLDGRTLTVTEKDRATCVGMQGQLPEPMFPGKVHQYIHLSGAKGVHYTLEYFNGQIKAFKGVWIDPYDILSI